MQSVRVYLLVLVTGCVALASVAFGLIIYQANARHRLQVTQQAQEIAQAMSRSVDGKIEHAMGVLTALRASDAVRRQDWAAFDLQARAALTDPNAWIVVQDRRGQQLVNTRLPPDAVLPRSSPPANMWQVLGSGRSHVCNLVTGAVERRILCVDVPAFSNGGAPIAISVIFRPDVFAPIVSRQGVREGMLASLVDRNAVVIWRNLKPERFIGHLASGPMRARIRASSVQGTLESRSLDGVPMLTAYHRSQRSGWTVVVGVPKAQVGSFSKGALVSGGLLALTILALSGAMAIWLGRRITNGLDNLAGAVVDADRDQPRSTGLAEFDAAAVALHRANRHQQILIGELNHRVKNTLAIVQSLAQQTLRAGGDPATAVASFESRLGALAGTHDVLTRERWERASLREIISVAIRPFCAPACCTIAGPDLDITPQSAVNFALSVHELATNAVKYGALSTPTGHIAINWSSSPDGQFTFAWEEIGGPAAALPPTTSFGMRLIKRTLAAELSGTVDFDFRPQGLRVWVTGKTPTPPVSRTENV